jgi:hypothetical protein
MFLHVLSGWLMGISYASGGRNIAAMRCYQDNKRRFYAFLFVLVSSSPAADTIFSLAFITKDVEEREALENGGGRQVYFYFVSYTSVGSDTHSFYLIIPLIGKHFAHEMYFAILAAFVDVPSRWSVRTMCPLRIGVMPAGDPSIFSATHLVRSLTAAQRTSQSRSTRDCFSYARLTGT